MKDKQAYVMTDNWSDIKLWTRETDIMTDKWTDSKLWTRETDQWQRQII